MFILFETKSIYSILIHIRLCCRVSDKNFFTRPISGNKTTSFLALGWFVKSYVEQLLLKKFCKILAWILVRGSFFIFQKSSAKRKSSYWFYIFWKMFYYISACIVRNPPFLKGEGVNFDYLHRRGVGDLKSLKKGWKYGVGAGLLKREGAGTFTI